MWLWGMRATVILLSAVLLVAGVLLCIVCTQAESALFESAYADKIRIYIDQGHNPLPHHNTGAEGNGLYEQDVVFHVGCLLEELLREDGRFEVCLSRPQSDTVLGSDNASSLQARVDGAAAFSADYFISLHINAYTDEKVNGLEVFVLPGNRASYALGDALLEGLVDSTGLKSRGVKDGGDLYVLKHASIPAVLVEMGFISNAEDAGLLSEHPEMFAKGVYNGILTYFFSRDTMRVRVLLWTIVFSAVLILALSIVLVIVKKKIRKQEQQNSKRVFRRAFGMYRRF